MCQNTLHLDTARLLAVRIVAFGGMDQVSYALFNGGLSLFLGILWSFLGGGIVIQSQTKFVHWMFVANRLIAGHTEVKVLRRGREREREREREGESSINITSDLIDHIQYVLACVQSTKDSMYMYTM